MFEYKGSVMQTMALEKHMAFKLDIQVVSRIIITNLFTSSSQAYLYKKKD
jgi:hypothetical protein